MKDLTDDEKVKLAQEFFRRVEIAGKKGKKSTDLREIKQLLMQCAFIPPELVTL